MSRRAVISPIGTKRTCSLERRMSVVGGRTDLTGNRRHFRVGPKAEIGAGRPWLCIAYVRTPSSGVGSDRDLDLPLRRHEATGVYQFGWRHGGVAICSARAATGISRDRIS